MCRPLFRLGRPFMIFEGCLDSNPECCRSKLARYRLSRPSLGSCIYFVCISAVWSGGPVQFLFGHCGGVGGGTAQIFLSPWLCSGGYGTAEMVKGVVRVFLAFPSSLSVLLADGHW